MKIKLRIDSTKKEQYRCSKCGRILDDIGWCCFEIVNGERSPCAVELVE